MSQKKDRNKILFFRESTFKVVELIFNKPNTTFHIRMLEKETGFSTTAVTSSVHELEVFNIVTVEKGNLTTNIKADLSSEAYRFYKLIFNLYRLKHYNLVDTLVDLFHNPKAIVLFGSFARGEDIEESDIDLLITSSEKIPKGLEKIQNVVEKLLQRNLNLHVLPSLTKSSTEFKNAVANGTVLHGYLKVV